MSHKILLLTVFIATSITTGLCSQSRPVLNRSSNDYQALLKTVVGEAVGESKLGQIAVAWVVLNRVQDRRWPNTISGVCYQRHQFSCMTNPNLKNLMRSSAAKTIDTWLPRVYQDHNDPTGGANHYYAFQGPSGIRPPRWARSGGRTIDIGSHRFYRL